MTQEDYNKLLDFAYVGGGFIPANIKATEYAEQCVKGEIVSFKEATQRDISFHRCYFSLLNYIWKYLPKSFRDRIPESEFYKWLKHLKEEYEVKYTFKDGTQLVEYTSISFGMMSQKEFKDYVKNQLPYIYENVIGVFFEGDIYIGIIDNIENEYERFMAKL